MADHPNFWEDVFPLFTDTDIACMRAKNVLLGSIDWWKSGGNFANALHQVKSGRMPLGGPPWDAKSVETLEAWKANGFAEGPRPSDS